MSAFRDWSRKQTQRMAAEEILGDIRLEKLITDAGNALENQRQADIVQRLHPEINVNDIGKGSNRLATTVLAKQLLRGEVPTSSVADRFVGRDYRDKSQLGIDGPFKQDSEIRGFTKLKTEADPTDGETLYSIEKVGVPTEYLSEEETKRQYDTYLTNLRPQYRRTQSNPFSFNSHLGEYYGQQALKLAGARAPSNEERSEQQLNNPYPESSVLGTDRIIETNPKMSSPEIQGLPPDFRYVAPNGKVVVADMQMTDDRGRDTSLTLNLLKKLNAYPEDKQNLENNLRSELKDSNKTLDEAFNSLINKELLPQITQQTPRNNEFGMRAGKVLADAPTMGQLNADQFRNQKVLFGLGPRGYRDNLIGGAIPHEFVLVDNERARNVIANEIARRNNPIVVRGNNKVDAVVPRVTLTREKAAGRLPIEQNIMQQFKQPYSL